MPAQVEPITQAEALPRLLLGKLVGSLDMAARLGTDGRFSVSEEELLNPKSWPREDGLPVVAVEGISAPFFNPEAVLSFLEEWLRMSPEEIAELEEQERQEAAEAAAREAEMIHDLEHPKAETRIAVTQTLCQVIEIRVQDGLSDEDPAVREATAASAKALLEGLIRLIPSEVSDAR